MSRPGAVATSLVRRLNAEVMLDALRGAGPMTAADLMAATRLSRPTVHAVADALVGIGLIRNLPEVGQAASPRGGRPARRYEFHAGAGFVVAIDIGVHKVRASVADLRGERLGEAGQVLEDPAADREIRMAAVFAVVDQARAEAGVSTSAPLAACVGCPAAVDADGVLRVQEPLLPGMHGRNLAEEVHRHLGCPVQVENDANLAVLGERWRGAAAGVDDVVLLLAGERMGAGIVLGGRLLRGRGGGAGEMGFLASIEPNGGAEGVAHLVRTAGAEAVARMSAQRLPATTDPDSLRGRVGDDPRKVEAEMVFAAARSGDPVAEEIISRIVDRTARTIGILATVLDPSLVVIGGGVAGAEDVLLVPLREALGRYVPDRPELRLSELGDHAVLTGATRLALEQAEASLFAEFSAE
jgi:predicted NBD/HSP70 family sugar kinase